MGVFENNKHEQVYNYRELNDNGILDLIEDDNYEEIEDEDFEDFEDEYSEDYYAHILTTKDGWFEYYIEHAFAKYLSLNDISLREDYIDSFEYIFETFSFIPIFKESYEFIYHYHFEIISELFGDLISKLMKINVEKKNINLFHNIIIEYLLSDIENEN